ncbi:MAG: catechol 2,3-dioxygenase-like lactoylglutathione lyase family enzyme [Limisphaerales bacterium]|jgi:glyoxylase I family protein
MSGSKLKGGKCLQGGRRDKDKDTLPFLIASIGRHGWNPAMSKPSWTVEHLGLPASDPRALHEWYVRVLDAELVWSDDSVPVYFVRLPGGTVLEIGPCGRTVEDVSDNTVAGLRHIALQVESLEAAREELASRGVSFPEDPKPAGGGGSVQFFADAEGNLLHLVERPQDSVFLSQS